MPSQNMVLKMKFGEEYMRVPAVIVNPGIIIDPPIGTDLAPHFLKIFIKLKHYTTGVNGFVDVEMFQSHYFSHSKYHTF